MAIVSMIVSVNGAGTVPLGAVIPVGNAGAWALPASGEIKDGFALCDGGAFPAGSHPSFVGNRPNLSDSRFLQGSASAGGTGGSNSKTTTGIAATFDKNVMNTNQNAHSHTFDKNVLNSDQNGHSHALPFAGGGPQGVTFGPVYTGSDLQRTPWFGNFDYGADQAIFKTPITGFTTSSFNNRYLFNSASSLATWNSSTVTTSAPTITWNSATVSTTVTQGSINDIRPQYFDVVYLMRVI